MGCMADASAPDALLDEPIVGWRAWNLSATDGDPLLEPAGSGTGAWQPRQALAARCRAPALLTGVVGRHDAPDARCTCGIYAARSLDTFERNRPAWPPPTVIGTIALWGRIVEHERGWRARYAYPSRLRLVCAVCAWVEPGSGVPAVMHGFAGRLFALCQEHRGGIELPDGRRTRATSNDPPAIQARLLDAYAVDLLPTEAVDRLFARPPSPAVAAYIPSIRIVPGDTPDR